MLRMIGVLFLFLCGSFTVDAAQTTSRLHWMTNFDEALAKAKNEKKNLFLYFTGSDWCHWCHKLDSEVLDTQEFADAVGNQFVFVLFDFPSKATIDPAVAAENKRYQKDFNVKGFPTVILLDDQQKPIGTSGYRPGGPKAYADFLIKMVDDYKSYKQKISHLDTAKILPVDLEALYRKAAELDLQNDAERIVEVGLNTSDNHFFLLEKFRSFANEGKLRSAKAQAVKQQLIKQDPENLKKTHYQLAVIEFEAGSEEMEQEDYAPEITAAPIIAYIDRFGETDPENAWRLQMIVSQIFLDKNKIQEALKYAKASHASAPQGVQSDILVFIRNIQETMSPITAKK